MIERPYTFFPLTHKAIQGHHPTRRVPFVLPGAAGHKQKAGIKGKWNEAVKKDWNDIISLKAISRSF